MIENISKNAQKIIEYLANNMAGNININQLARILDISVGSVHKILKHFEKEDIVISEPIGNSIVYKLNSANRRTQNLIDEVNLRRPIRYLKKTKIVCTLGPSCNSVGMIRKMVENGMDVARINSSHATEASMLDMISKIRKVDTLIPILVDIPGIKIRLGRLEKDTRFKKGDLLTFCSNDKEGCIKVDHTDLHKKLVHGRKFSMNDGGIGFVVHQIKEDAIICRALNDGIIKSRRGINIPGLYLGEEHLTESDKKLIKFCLKNKIAFIGVSFIKSAEQVKMIERLFKGTETKLISKIETQEAIEDYEKIIEESFGIMIDRGDLGAEIGLEKIPRFQKKIIEECNSQGKPIIVATQMLDSMTDSPYPTKSEITDVANAVLDGASALMLSAETAIGKYPLETISTMNRIICDIETEITPTIFDDVIRFDDFTNVIDTAISHICRKIKVDKILCLTHGGYSARMLARNKLSTPIVGISNNSTVCSIMNLMWGVNPILVKTNIDNSASVEQKKNIIYECLEKGAINKQDTILLTGAVFPDIKKKTNLVEIHKVNELLGYFEGLKKDD